jgi:hypothetical protein
LAHRVDYGRGCERSEVRSLPITCPIPQRRFAGRGRNRLYPMGARCHQCTGARSESNKTGKRLRDRIAITAMSKPRSSRVFTSRLPVQSPLAEWVNG